MNVNLSTLEVISLVLWIAALVGVVAWGLTFRRRQRDLMGNRKTYYIISAVVICLALGGLLGRGLQYGLDFTGGTIVEVASPQMVTTQAVRDIVKKDFPSLKDVQIQVGSNMETDPQGKQYQKVLVRAQKDGERPELEVEEAKALIAGLEKGLGGGTLEELQITSIGPTVTGELKRNAIIALVLALVMQLLYITLRFGNQMRFGLAADVALFHDVIIMVGLYSLAGLQVDSPWVAALLTVAGYSVMDSVVIFDRIRENVKVKKGTFQEIVNESVNETMTRSINTTLTTVVVCVALYYFGGSTLKSFAFALIVGIISGAYSSIFVASPVLIEIDNWARAKEKERARERREASEARARSRSGSKQVASEAAEEGYPTSEELPEAGDERAAPKGTRRRRTKGTRRR